MTSVEVAVIIPTLNEERFIESCLQSVINMITSAVSMAICAWSLI